MAKYVLGDSAARKLREIFASYNGSLRQQQSGNGSLSLSRVPDPFEVRWAASVNNGQGAFIIWIPSDSVLVVNLKALNVKKKLSAAGEPYPEGWFIVEALPAEGGPLYLNIGASDSPGEDDGSLGLQTVDFATEPFTEAGAISILIAVASKDNVTGKVSIKQNVTSAIFFINKISGQDSGGGGSGGSGSENEKFGSAFEYYTASGARRIRNCKFIFNGEDISLPDYLNPPTDGPLYLFIKGTRDSESGKYSWTYNIQEIPGQAGDTNDKIVNIILYTFIGGGIECDYRTSFLTVNAPDSFGEPAFKLNGQEIARVSASEEINVGIKKIVAGSGIKVEETGASEDSPGEIIISSVQATTAEEGFTGERTVLADFTYNASSRQLQRRYVKETWEKGRLVNSELQSLETVHTAVEETVGKVEA